ncbi:hypothetical protein GLOTRDRAFT_140134 [Gloeophyllum trabeum ATCC 11539]|uniref:C2H2-type domain-containing protein n=1 Tax=Gloeophyllum trabeum (strain ATCC 11539 / FP-39264 / Madison 617) TaxID=670483 RepID=S7Q198_GLOTA|nr:uncharacterized protein GLOTRDRAFT_140134 [Gloeophyllum trabeum ATCC 11539]EPQ53282.1 hypothetical protein GLOTRDRAFT_140134 [Gloeophyllum trabeum ATCC 11539]
MTRSIRSPSPSPGPLSPSFSDSSADEDLTAFADYEAGVVTVTPSRPGSPASVNPQSNSKDTDTVACQWEDCGKVFTHLPTLIEHIHNDHIGVHKSNYTCEWATCSRRGLAQTSRFALISHIRSHTGEKPFTCPRPECDKSFTRSDALVKHMRLQHNISPPLPGRGGNRKRKREEPEVETPTTHGFTTFKVEAQTPSDMPYEDGALSGGEGGDYFNLGRRSASPSDADSEQEDGVPPHLMQAMDPQTGLIMGRSPSMVKYLVMKAKHGYALEQHEALIEELRVVRHEERLMREAKDMVFDEVLRRTFGHHCEPLCVQPRLPQMVPEQQRYP